MSVAARAFFVGMTCFALVACFRAPSLDRSTLQSVAAEAKAILGEFTATTPMTLLQVPSARWPKTIRALNPDAVRATSEGLYISTGSLLVEEWGYFVPRNETAFDPRATRDPSYTLLGEGVYEYEIKG